MDITKTEQERKAFEKLQQEVAVSFLGHLGMVKSTETDDLYKSMFGLAAPQLKTKKPTLTLIKGGVK